MIIEAKFYEYGLMPGYTVLGEFGEEGTALLEEAFGSGVRSALHGFFWIDPKEKRIKPLTTLSHVWGGQIDPEEAYWNFPMGFIFDTDEYTYTETDN